MSDHAVAVLNTIFVPAGLVLIMFSLGLTLVLSDFGRVLGSLRLVVVGLTGQLVLGRVIRQGLGQHRGEQFDVGTAGQLRHHSPIAGVQVDLAAHHRRHDHRPAVDHRGGRLVARGLDPEDHGAGLS